MLVNFGLGQCLNGTAQSGLLNIDFFLRCFPEEKADLNFGNDHELYE